MKWFTLKAARIQAGIGRAEAAERLGVRPDSIWRLEIGTQSPPARTAEKMCEMYGLSFDEIDWGRKEET